MSAPPVSWPAAARNVIVTGGSRGLGFGMACQLAAAINKVRDQGTGSLHFRPFDLNEIAALPGLVKELRGKFGALHSLINNAGIGTSGMLAITPDRLIEQMPRLNVLPPSI